ncbi:unnamed protein product [Cylindrotheca closterium]|uniref:Uncharacterized protein n=1 Tax=Cylindrotheca closterium TaxID=2856 RepID=A0AAD2FZH9_9STRA|nr:unnamed protein product [Cylindrotheca closterium]
MPSELSIALEQSVYNETVTTTPPYSEMTSAASAGPTKLECHPNDNPLPSEGESSTVEKEHHAPINTDHEHPVSFLPLAGLSDGIPGGDGGFFIEDNKDDVDDGNDQDAENGGLQQQDDASGETDLLSKSPSSTAASFPSRSILKAEVHEEIPIRTNQNRWKQLPAPDMEYVKMKRIESLNSIASRNSAPDLALLNAEPKSPESPKSPKPPSSSPAMRKSDSKVTFQHITVREYDQTIGDNPSVGYGAPISLDWHYQEDEPLHVDLYESNRGGRRNMEQMHINHNQRKAIFTRNYGFSESEVKAAQKATDKVKSQREFSRFVHMSMPSLIAVEEVRESAVRKFKRYRAKKKTAECNPREQAATTKGKKSTKGDVVEASMTRVQSAPRLQ